MNNTDSPRNVRDNSQSAHRSGDVMCTASNEITNQSENEKDEVAEDTKKYTSDKSRSVGNYFGNYLHRTLS